MIEPPPAPPSTPPAIYRAHLSELTGCYLDVTCACGCRTAYRLMSAPRKDRQLGEVTSRLVCKRCRRRPATIHLREPLPPYAAANDQTLSVQLYPPPALH